MTGLVESQIHNLGEMKRQILSIKTIRVSSTHKKSWQVYQSVPSRRRYKLEACATMYPRASVAHKKFSALIFAHAQRFR